MWSVLLCILSRVSGPSGRHFINSLCNRKHIPRSSRAAREPKLAGIVILIVDDHLDTCQVLVRLLRTHGLPAECIDNPEAALAAVKSLKPALLVLDQMMPGLRGTDILRAVRATPGVSDIPAIFYSAAAGDGDEQEARRLGALDWVTKGKASWDELRRKVLAAYKPGTASN
jgi:CheY-like chemotaxis protein